MVHLNVPRVYLKKRAKFATFSFSFREQLQNKFERKSKIEPTMASKRIFRACKLQGLSLHADALARLTEELTKYVVSSSAGCFPLERLSMCL